MRLKTLGVGFLAALALGASASVASATPKLWLLTSGTSKGVVGEKAENHLELVGPGENFRCGRNYTGKLLSNGLASDSLEFPTSTGFCTAGSVSRGGQAATVVATAKGSFKLTFKPKLIVGEPGWCAYELSKIELPFNTTGLAFLFWHNRAAAATAKLDKAHTLAENCPATQAWEVRTEAVYDHYGQEGFEYGTEVVG